jgi:hypothetical protein
MQLPHPRGPISESLVSRLSGTAAVSAASFPLVQVSGAANPLADDDLQLALWMLYELHYRGFAGVSDECEWDLDLLAARRRLEVAHEAGLRSLVGAAPACDVANVPAELDRVVRADDGPLLSSYLQRQATVEQFREFVMHRSVYHLKEADPHAWGIPRLSGAPKAALIEIEFDEYGSGRPERMHAELFRGLLRGLGLDDSYGQYVDDAPGSTLAVSNTISLFGLHRRLRGALAGHLAAFEMTSTLPNRAYSNGVQRLGFGPDVAEFFDEHVEADAVHEQIAAHDLCGSLARAEPALVDDILFGARAALGVDRLFAEHLLACWADGRSSLYGARESDLLTA